MKVFQHIPGQSGKDRWSSFGEGYHCLDETTHRLQRSRAIRFPESPLWLREELLIVRYAAMNWLVANTAA
jgi:hypothetical protein